ncbi:bifunctional ADP-dependent NAD(P)H-hydrate dehydratase/NAD(P)H-hydrate epimerase [Bifidobacterium sp. ESL0790]|uniref:bifunctional ADP-dependent NAD(P)H-hydrate dehydratase/NAD(P)H-hydrate epimerase n=1 Tax=Bifidobacterium sp. ESL0790 TaxID=2983233 RepID=UPI0023F98F6E|nr:bifunctional ADP-dependent NAD(P)H-hydrate dehydratase/NAD(P)H-hydrate epimerase [Bifidobacterium sp. ESL0790]WEV71685.1 bifunctional ADP-dependent NAD(P)H-hydrate dehydratase/NAD(P)H-hydrate epimerase [Bifidobacterium sp. ESL0790]
MDERMADLKRQQQLRHNAYDVETVRGLERPLLDRGVPLMRMAASAAAHVTADLLEDNGIEVASARVVLLAGAGDNGGDGLYAAAHLANAGAQVTAVAVGKTLHLAGLVAFTHAGGRLLVLDPNSKIPGGANGFSAGEAGERLKTSIGLASRADVVLDAMTGIGVHGALRGLAATMAHELRKVVEKPANKPASMPLSATVSDDDTAPLVVAIDTPSGMDVDGGTLPGDFIPADVTTMFGAMKPCAMLPPASFACGRVVLVDFGFDISHAKPAITAMDEQAANLLRQPEPTDSKYSRGVAGLITGSARYPGAAVLSSRAAVRSNVGMVRYIGPANASDMVLRNTPEIVIGKGHVQAWAVGSGVPTGAALGNETIGRHGSPSQDSQRSAIAALLSHYSLDDSTRSASQTSEAIDFDKEPWSMPPICVDAGALDLLPERVPAHVVITPHAGEMAALLASRGEEVEVDDILAEPLRWAKKAHELTGATVLLKGAVTIVVGDAELRQASGEPSDSGNADKCGTEPFVLVSGSGPSWLATAGAGDVLAGLMAGMLAQQGDDALQRNPKLCVATAAAASYIHGYAAQLASDGDQCGWRAPQIFDATDDEDDDDPGHPIVASDVVTVLPKAIGRLLAL